MPSNPQLEPPFRYSTASLLPTIYNIEHPASLCPPLAVVVWIAVLQRSSKASFTSSPVTAEHSIYRSARNCCAAAYASCGYMMPFGSSSDLRSRFSPRTTIGRTSMRSGKALLISSLH